MRVIRLNGATPPAAWLAKAMVATQQLEAAADKNARDAIIDNNQPLWTELKPWLMGFSKDKCWFSEARAAFHHWDVEHFRPKKAAKNLDGTLRGEGYWWLTFAWENFRICGNVGNVKKGAFFPLRGAHAASAADRNILDEDHYLLDPIREDDPAYLTFTQNGDVIPTAEIGAWQTQRATESIKRYKLQAHEKLVEARRDIWAACVREINHWRNYLQQQESAPSATNRERLRKQTEKLQSMGSFEEEFSAVVSDCLLSCPEPFLRKLAHPR